VGAQSSNAPSPSTASTLPQGSGDTASASPLSPPLGKTPGAGASPHPAPSHSSAKSAHVVVVHRLVALILSSSISHALALRQTARGPIQALPNAAARRAV
jgi:hypothetical protein